MPRSMQEWGRLFRQRLTRLDDQPLGKAALAVILFLDIFILGAIFDGLSDHTRQLTAPDERIPPLCRDIVTDTDWNPTNRVDLLARMVTRHHASPVMPEARDDGTATHPLCAPIVRAYRTIRDDADLARDLREIDRLRRESHDLREALERTRSAHDTRLLESIAGRQPATSEADPIRKETAARTADLNDLVGREQRLVASLERDARVGELFGRVAGVAEADRQALRDELRRLDFWYPARRLGMEMLFLLPLLAVFYFWNARSLAGRRPFQALLSSHLLVVVVIPVFLKLGELVYDIIPRKLLSRLIELLASLGLVAIWHYLVIGLAILAALALIHLFQKKLFSREKLTQRRIARGLCQECGQRLAPGSRHCPACGAVQFRTCDRCQAPTPLHGRYCTACGQASRAVPETPRP